MIEGSIVQLRKMSWPTLSSMKIFFGIDRGFDENIFGIELANFEFDENIFWY